MRRTLLCAAILSLGLVATAQGQGRPQIILFQEDNFRGQQLVVDGDIERIKLLHFDDRASSVRVISGIWELCADDVFRGRCITVRRDEPKLGRLGMDDSISSLRPISKREYRDRRDGRRDDWRDGRRDDRGWH